MFLLCMSTPTVSVGDVWSPGKAWLYKIISSVATFLPKQRLVWHYWSSNLIMMNEITLMFSHCFCFIPLTSIESSFYSTLVNAHNAHDVCVVTVCSFFFFFLLSIISDSFILKLGLIFHLISEKQWTSWYWTCSCLSTHAWSLILSFGRRASQRNFSTSHISLILWASVVLFLKLKINEKEWKWKHWFIVEVGKIYQWLTVFLHST